MRIAETLNEGLKREYSVHISASDLAAKVDAQLGKVAGQIKMPGFRPGKVPLNLVRKMHGAQLRGEALQAVVEESMQQLISEHALRPAMQPEVKLDSVPADGADVDFTVAVEVLPTIATPQIDGITLEKLVVEPGDAEIDAAVERLATQQKSFEPAAEGHAAATGDVVVMDFEGRTDGELFDGGKGEGMRIELGSGGLIPGFEDQLIGIAIGDERTIKLTFPADYNVAYLKGREAEFAVKATAIETAKPVVIDDSLATGLGIDNLAALREILKDQVDAELRGLTRIHMKRKLLDALAAAHDFAVPESMVNAEFDQIWAQVSAEDADASEDDRAEYRRIAERRVRLGLLLSEIGQGNGVAVSQAEMNRLIGQEAAKYPGQQQQVVKHFQENPMAAAQLRAPLYEDKVVDFLLGKAQVTERHVTRDELQAEIESDDETPGVHVHGPDCGHDNDHDRAHEAEPAAIAAPVAPKRAAKSKPAAKAAVSKAVAGAPAIDAAAATEIAASGDGVAPIAGAAPAKPTKSRKSVASGANALAAEAAAPAVDDVALGATAELVDKSGDAV